MGDLRSRGRVPHTPEVSEADDVFFYLLIGGLSPKGDIFHTEGLRAYALGCNCRDALGGLIGLVTWARHGRRTGY